MTALMSTTTPFDFMRDLDRLFYGNSTTRAFLPPADIVTTDDDVTIYMDVPGLSQDEIDIELDGDLLTIKGERSYPYATQNGSQPATRIERSFGKWERALSVGQGLDAEHIAADLSDGVLTLRIPKAESSKPRRIQISAGSGDSRQLEEAVA